MHILSPETDNCPSWISGRGGMTVENISWSISTKECCRPRRGSNPRPPGLQSDGASNWATEAGPLSDNKIQHEIHVYSDNTSNMNHIMRKRLSCQIYLSVCMPSPLARPLCQVLCLKFPLSQPRVSEQQGSGEICLKRTFVVCISYDGSFPLTSSYYQNKN